MARKPTSDTVVFDMGEPIAVDGLTVGPDGSITLYSKGKALSPDSATFTRFRERGQGKEKPLISFPSDVLPTPELEARELSKYDAIFAVDTNSRKIRGEFISFATIVACLQASQTADETLIKFAHAPVGGFEFHGMVSEQEKLAWLLLQDAICRSPDYSVNAQYLILTDHDKNRHPEINQRKLPLFENTFLAHNITLAFASGDSGAAFAQRMVRECDKGSNKFLKEIEAKKIPEIAFREFDAAPISRFRLVQAQSMAWPAGYKPFRLSMDLPTLTDFEQR